MQKLITVADLTLALGGASRPIALVPTMGALHAGHLSLLREARAHASTVVASIFVNPIQFGANEDFEKYPRPLSADLEKLAAEHVDFAFTPTAAEMYPGGFATTIRVGGPALPLEGKIRPDHFDGVGTVVAKLLLQALPDLVYLGQKDGQQAAVIKRLVVDLNIPSRVVVMPTVREHDGLAVSSRNAYLSKEQRIAAGVIYRALSATRDRFRSGQQKREHIEATCRALIAAEPLVDAIEYVAAVHPDTIQPWVGGSPCMLAAAVRMGELRLIDNVIMD